MRRATSGGPDYAICSLSGVKKIYNVCFTFFYRDPARFLCNGDSDNLLASQSQVKKQNGSVATGHKKKINLAPV